MGYYTEYFSTLLKSNWALSYKQRWDSRRVVRFAKRTDILIYETLPEKVEIEHKVTSALKDEDKAIEFINDVIKYGLQVAFNSAYQDESILRATRNLIKNWEKIHEIMDKMKRDNDLFNNITIQKAEPELEELSKKFVIMIRNQTQKAEGQEREEMKDVMNLVNESHNVNHEQFLSKARSTFRSISSQTMLARYAFRYAIVHEKRLINDLERLSIRLEELHKRLERVVNNIKDRHNEFPEILEQFKVIIKKSEKDIEGAFLYSYRIKKRDFSLMLTMMINTEVLKELNLKWIRLHFLPELIAYQKIKQLENLEEKMAQKLHVVAQALRIEINANEDIQNKAMPLLRK